MSPKCKICDGGDLNYYDTVNFWHGIGNGFGAGWVHVSRHPGGTESFCEDQEYWDKREDEIDTEV